MSPLPKRLPKLEKARSLQRLPAMPGLKAAGTGQHRNVDFDIPVPEPLQTADEAAIQVFGRAVGDDALAKRVINWQKDFYKGMEGTKLEGVLYDWLSQRKIAFDYQEQFFGGRGVKGGLVADFVIHKAGTGMVWLPNGVFWHSTSDVKEADNSAKFRYLGAIAPSGLKIDSVVFMAEKDIITPIKAIRDRTLNQAMSGIEVGR